MTMNKGDQISSLLPVLVATACVVVIVAGMKAAAPLLSNIFLAWLLAYSISPLPHWLMRKRIPAALAVLLTLLIVVVGGLAIASLFGLSVSGLIQKLPTYQARLTEVFESLKNFPLIGNIDFEKIKSLDIISPARLVGYAGAVLGGIGGILGNTLLIIFLVAILLFEFVGTKEGSQEGSETQEWPYNKISGCKQGCQDVCGNHGRYRPDAGNRQHNPPRSAWSRFSHHVGRAVLLLQFYSRLRFFTGSDPPVDHCVPRVRVEGSIGGWHRVLGL